MELKIEYLPIDFLKPYDGNARTHSAEQVRQIAESMRQFGFANPVLANVQNVVIAGHGRLLAAQLLGLKTIPVIRLGHLSERQQRALVLADNKIALNAGWDFARLSDELSALISADFDLSFTGFDEQEIDALLKSDADILPASWDQPPTDGPAATVAQSVSEAAGPQAATTTTTTTTQTTEFQEFGDNIGFDYCCPKCRFVWSGKPK